MYLVNTIDPIDLVISTGYGPSHVVRDKELNVMPDLSSTDIRLKVLSARSRQSKLHTDDRA